MNKLSLILLNLLLLLSATFAMAQDEEELLDPKEAFALSVSAEDANTLVARWQIAEGYYLYRSKFQFHSNSDTATLEEAQFPAGKVKHDEFFGDIEIYRHSVEARIPITWQGAQSEQLSVTITSQGCADVGVCYPPQRDTFNITLPTAAPSPSSPMSTPAEPSALEKLTGLGDSLLGNANEDELLPPEKAFPFTAIALDGNTIVARWDIVPGHYLYKDRFSFSLEESDGVTLGEVQMPKGDEKNDEFFGLIEVYHQPMEATLPLLRQDKEAKEVTLNVKYQGCAEVGVCYPPQRQSVRLTLPAAGAVASAAALLPAKTTSKAVSAPLSEQDSLAASLASGNTATTIALFFGLGLLLAFTPCVFPMIPILSSIIVGQGEGLTTRKAFTLSLVYVLAMALTYTVAGVIAGLFGANLQAAFQNPWILGSFSAVFVALSLSMFGFFELQLPSALQTKLTEVSNKQQGGTLAGVAIMGLLSALIVGPCVAPPLMGALIYIGQTGDALLGGLALFALSLGMGAPLLAIGVSAGKFLPRAGGWMDSVKAVFGVLLLAVAIWMLERILPDALIMLLWALLAIISAVYMGAIDAIREGASGWFKLWKGLGMVLLLQGALMLVGLAGGNTDPLQPLKGLALSAGAAVPQQHLQFKKVKGITELEREVKAASSEGKTVMLDFYADWCVSCKEFEKYTFSNPAVMSALVNTVALQADVTANDEADQELLQRFNLIGPPGIIFYSREGVELTDHRVVGYMEADAFANHVRRAFAQ